MLDYAKHHLFYLIIIAIGLIAFRSWLQEHDARLQADTQVKASEARVQQLNQDLAKVQAEAAQTIAALQKKKIEVKTAPAAIAAIPDISNLPVTSVQHADGSIVAQVDPVQLYQTLNQCKQDAVARTACEQTVTLKDQVIAEKDTEIKALKKKPGFWRRVGGQLKSGAVWTAIGITIAKVAL